MTPNANSPPFFDNVVLQCRRAVLKQSEDGEATVIPSCCPFREEAIRRPPIQFYNTLNGTATLFVIGSRWLNVKRLNDSHSQLLVLIVFFCTHDLVCKGTSNSIEKMTAQAIIPPPPFLQQFNTSLPHPRRSELVRKKPIPLPKSFHSL